MNRYRYEAADASGKVEAGHVEADSQSAAFASLRSRGLTALLVQIAIPFSPSHSMNSPMAWDWVCTACILASSGCCSASMLMSIPFSWQK